MLQEFCLTVDIIIEFFMMVSGYFEQSVILRPIAASFANVAAGGSETKH